MLKIRHLSVRILFQHLGSLITRSVALGSKLVFTLVAVVLMTPDDFGVYAIVASFAVVLTQIIGLEAYQIFLREMAQGHKDSDLYDKNRRLYAIFVLLGVVVAGLSSIAFFSWFRWPATIVVLAGLVVSFEHAGTEISRILIAEDRSVRAIQSVAVRSGLWCLVLTIAALFGLRNWSIELVLASWLGSSVIGSLFLWGVARRYVPTFALVREFWPWFAIVAVRSGPWLLVAFNWRFLETGVRLVPSFLEGEAAAGKFTFLATLAAIGLTVEKAVLEALYIVRMTRVEGGAGARREFAVTLALWLALAATITFAVFFTFAAAVPQKVATGDVWIVAILVLALGAMALSQIPHFALYAAGRDRDIQIIAVACGATSLLATVGLSLHLGLLGTALGLLIGGVFLLAGKQWYARGLPGDGHLVR